MVNISKLISIYLCLIPYIIKDTTSHSAHICQFCKINSIENHMNYSIFKLTVIKSMRSMLRKSTQTSRDNNMTGRGQNCGRLLKCKVLLWVLTNQKVYCSKIIANIIPCRFQCEMDSFKWRTSLWSQRKRKVNQIL